MYYMKVSGFIENFNEYNSCKATAAFPIFRYQKQTFSFEEDNAQGKW